jgi:hypothetical protein
MTLLHCNRRIREHEGHEVQASEKYWREKTRMSI